MSKGAGCYPPQKNKKKKKNPAKTAKKKSQKIPKNSQKFSKNLSVTLPIFPKCSFPKQKLLFPAIPPPCSSSFLLRRRRRRRLHVPFLPCSNVACFRALFFLAKTLCLLCQVG